MFYTASFHWLLTCSSRAYIVVCLQSGLSLVIKEGQRYVIPRCSRSIVISSWEMAAAGDSVLKAECKALTGSTEFTAWLRTKFPRIPAEAFDILEGEGFQF